ncbi:hypothetical protein A33M_3327 [Rhodovulum sp. PH10]|uniref:hypothetical protein n=1 Tax=Rhodovulum sp. PH10 TaxID=1187851 RepID=UPI00027C2925|nr:hypothetical protein [Rhodovulum sp. PH10]EJW11249.1 hypothetical protein A33M_3327 [Rhodovulum sp. PH10]
MAATFSRRDLIDQALANLGVLAAGQTPEAEDVDRLDRLVDAVMADLAARDVAWVPYPGELGPLGGEIDPAQFLYLAAILADAGKGAFGVAADASIYVLRQQAEEALRTIGRPPETRRTLRTDPIFRLGSHGRRRGGW